METQSITPQPTSTSPARPQTQTKPESALPADRARGPGSFQALLERPDRDAARSKDATGAPEPATQPAPALLAGPTTTPLAESRSDVKPAATAPGAVPGQTTSVDQMLCRAAREVQLASDGRDRYLLRFELAEGELRGTRIALESRSGVISAVVVAAEAAQGPRLEQALEAARHALEARGIDVAGLEVRAGAGGHDGRGERGAGFIAGVEVPGDDGAPPAPALRAAAPARTSAAGLDYFV